MDKSRRRIYRYGMVGMRYHRNDILSMLSLGFKRGSEIDVYRVVKQLMTWIYRETGVRVEYQRVTVRENNSPDALWRTHVHIIWNAPYIAQRVMLGKLQAYVGEQMSVDIRMIKQGGEKKVARYVLQYLDSQFGEVRVAVSRGWLPDGYHAHWKAVKHDFREYVPRGVRKAMDDPDMVFKLLTQSSDAWYKAGVIENMNAWIDERRRYVYGGD